MAAKRVSVLIADDCVAIREAYTNILTQFGYIVRSADEGIAALVEIQCEVPDVLLSDLHMQGMSGFELLAVVRHQFPQIVVVAMSGAFSGEGVPDGVMADAFYEKGRSLVSLLHILETATCRERDMAYFPNISARFDA